MAEIRCTQCNQVYPARGLPFRCASCGGVYDFDGPPNYDPELVERELPGIWRYRHSFDLFKNAPVISLGEGRTPLIWERLRGLDIGLKMESQNPSGSYKDRATAVLVSQLLSHGTRLAVEDSSGNAGASFAAYAARGRMGARIFVPSSASGPKLRQIESYGAELRPVLGPRSAAAQEALQEALDGTIYASHAYLPFGLPGIATLAYELVEQLGREPGTVIAPAGHGSLLLGIIRGFESLQRGGLIERQPYYIGVQAKSCAPIWYYFTQGWDAYNAVREGKTIAEGVRVRHPVRLRALREEILPGGGEIIAIDEDDILPAHTDLGKRGILAEPTSALVWSAVQQVIGRVPEPIVLVLSGSGLKYYKPSE